MARRRAISKAALTEYRKARAALLRRISRAKKAGYDVSSFKVPDIPKYIREGSARRLRTLGEKFGKTRRSGGFTKVSLPSYNDRLVDLADSMITGAENWIDDHPVKAVKIMNEARIRHRGDEARQEFDNHGLNYDQFVRELANNNIAKSWPRLIEELERFLLDSDAYGYDGDLQALAQIFIEMTLNVDNNDLSIEERKDIGNSISDFLQGRDWVDMDIYGDD